MDTNLHTFPLPEQEAAKLNNVNQSGQDHDQGVIQPPINSNTPRPSWGFLGLVAGLTMAGAWLLRGRG